MPLRALRGSNKLTILLVFLDILLSKMDDFTRQCLIQINADNKAGRITKEQFTTSVLSILKHVNGGYIK